MKKSKNLFAFLIFCLTIISASGSPGLVIENKEVEKNKFLKDCIITVNTDYCDGMCQENGSRCTVTYVIHNCDNPRSVEAPDDVKANLTGPENAIWDYISADEVKSENLVHETWVTPQIKFALGNLLYALPTQKAPYSKSNNAYYFFYIPLQ